MTMIVVVDTGVANLGSITNMLRYLGIESIVSGMAEEIAGAEKLLLPGVGSFDAGMTSIAERELIEPLNLAISSGATVLGICLGMQLMLDHSEEGQRNGLGWIKGFAKRIDLGSNPDGLRVPHMGWNEIETRRPSPLLPEEQGRRFYFAHSYHAVCDDESDILATTWHGSEMTIAINRGRLYGLQFHPEKSHRYGMAVLKAFADLSP